MASILFYLPQFPAFGGIETVTAQLANRFSDLGFAVTIASHRSRDATRIQALRKGVAVCTMPDQCLRVSDENRAYLKQLVESRKIDVVIFQDSYSKIEHNLDGLSRNVKLVVCEHSAPYGCLKPSYSGLHKLLHFFRHPVQGLFPGRADRLRRTYLYNRSDAYVLLSNYYFGEFRALTQLQDSRKLRSIPNPIPNVFATVETDFSRKEHIALFVGTLAHGKGIMRLLKIILLMRKNEHDFGDWRFCVVGDGPQRSECECFIKQNKITNVELVGYQSDVTEYYRKASVLCLTSSREGFPMTLVEAMSYGCVPVVFSSFGSVFDIITDGVNGFLAPAFDLCFYADALAALISSPGRLTQMSVEACKVQDRFKMNKISEMWLNVFESLGVNALTGGR